MIPIHAIPSYIIHGYIFESVQRKKETPWCVWLVIFYLILYNICVGYVTLQIGCEHGIGINRFRLVFNDIGIDGVYSINAYPICVGQVDIIFWRGFRDYYPIYKYLINTHTYTQAFVYIKSSCQQWLHLVITNKPIHT